MRFFRFCRALCWLIARILFRFRVEGTENLPASGRAVLVANHTKDIDPGIIAAAVRRPFHAVAKKELFDKPVAAFFLRHLGAISVDRRQPGASAFSEMLKVLDNEGQLLIFPEGTRVADQSRQLRHLKAGAVMACQLGQAPMIPIIISAPRGIKLRRPVTVRIGKPIACSEFPAGENHAAHRDGCRLMQQRMIALREGKENV